MIIVIKRSSFIMLTIIKPFQKPVQDEPFSRTIHRVLVLNPVLSISSPGFQKSSPGFVKHECGFFSSPGPGFSRVRIFFESGPGFEVCRKIGLICDACSITDYKVIGKSRKTGN